MCNDASLSCAVFGSPWHIVVILCNLWRLTRLRNEPCFFYFLFLFFIILGTHVSSKNFRILEALTRGFLFIHFLYFRVILTKASVNESQISLPNVFSNFSPPVHSFVPTSNHLYHLKPTIMTFPRNSKGWAIPSYIVYNSLNCWVFQASVFSMFSHRQSPPPSF